jgi:hypothetical protein
MKKEVKLKEKDRVRVFWFGTYYKGTVTRLREELGVDVQLDHDVYLPRCQWKSVEPKRRAPWYISEKLPATDTVKPLPKPAILPVIIEEAPVKKITSITDIIGDDFRAELDKSFNKQKKFTRGKLKK